MPERKHAGINTNATEGHGHKKHQTFGDAAGIIMLGLNLIPKHNYKSCQINRGEKNNNTKELRVHTF